jgi:hypothetical protein
MPHNAGVKAPRQLYRHTKQPTDEFQLHKLLLLMLSHTAMYRNEYHKLFSLLKLPPVGAPLSIL